MAQQTGQTGRHVRRDDGTGRDHNCTSTCLGCSGPALLLAYLFVGLRHPRALKPAAKKVDKKRKIKMCAQGGKIYEELGTTSDTAILIKTPTLYAPTFGPIS